MKTEIYVTAIETLSLKLPVKIRTGTRSVLWQHLSILSSSGRCSNISCDILRSIFRTFLCSNQRPIVNCAFHPRNDTALSVLTCAPHTSQLLSVIPKNFLIYDTDLRSNDYGSILCRGSLFILCSGQINPGAHSPAYTEPQPDSCPSPTTKVKNTWSLTCNSHTSPWRSA